VLAAFEDDAIIDQVPDANNSPWKNAARKKPLSRLRALIRAIRGSGKRREEFYETIREGNSKKHFVNPEAATNAPQEPIHVPEQALLHDVITRWDSVYHMITRARSLRPVTFSS
jgi:hypothetical protein